MLNQFNTSTITHVIEIFLYTLLYTAHICLFLNISRFQKYPLSDLNYINAGIMSALITTGAFFTIRFSSMTYEIMLIAGTGFISATAITLTLQRVANLMFKREKETPQTSLEK